MGGDSTTRVIKMADISKKNAVEILGMNNPELLKHIIFEMLEEEYLENASPDTIKQDQYIQIGKKLGELSSLHNSEDDEIIWRMDNPYARKSFHVISICLGEDIDFHEEDLKIWDELVDLIANSSCLVNIYSKFDEVNMRICFEGIYQNSLKTET